MYATAAAPQSPPGHPAAAPPAPERRDRKWLRWTVLGIVIPVSVVATNFFTPFAILFAFVVLVPFEKLFPRHDYKLRRPGLAVDLQYGLLLPAEKLINTIFLIIIGAASMAWAPALLFRPLVSAQPPWLIAIETVVLFDLVGYWVHRAQHFVPALWRIHAIHHSSQRLDWIAGIRSHPLDGVIAGAPYAFILFLGLGSIEGLAIIGVIQVTAVLWAHSNVRWRLRPLQRIILTPEMHHWHHANEHDAYDRNFTNLLPIWDILFGTYYVPKDRRPSNYGLDEATPRTLWGQLREPLRHFRSPTILASGRAAMTTAAISTPTPTPAPAAVPATPVPYTYGQAPYPVGSWAPIPASQPPRPSGPPAEAPRYDGPPSGGTAF